MVLGLGMRTIWISLRAMNYTDRAFAGAIKNMRTLTDEEQDFLAVGLKMKDVTRMNVQVGMLWGATLLMTAKSLLGLVQHTERGAQYMESLNQTIQEMKVAFADTLFTALKPFMDVFKGLMEVMRDNEWLRAIILGFITLGMVLAGIVITKKILKGLNEGLIITGQIQRFLTGQQTAAEAAHLAILKAKIVANWKLAAATAAAMGIFGAMFLLLKDMHPAISAAIAIILLLAAAYIKLYIAESFATAGIAAIAGAAGAALATAYAISGGFQMGTRSAPYTGPMMVHKGEVIYNPMTERPTGVAKELEREGEGRVSNVYDTRITIEELHTKADVDDVDEKLGRSLWRKMRERR